MTWAERREPPRSLGGARVLVAEDEAVIALELEYVLGRAGAEVLGPALNVDDALALAGQSPLSAAVLDVRLGRRSIEPVARVLAAADVPFLFFSGANETDEVRRAWPGRTIIAKPASAAVLVAAVQALLGSAKDAPLGGGERFAPRLDAARTRRRPQLLK